MQAILTNLEIERERRGLSRELAHADSRQLLDIGLVRAADGSLRLAEDPSQPVGPGPRRQPRRALSGLFRWLRGLPLRSQNWHPHFFLRE
jgi:hypothetical protein